MPPSASRPQNSRRRDPSPGHTGESVGRLSASVRQGSTSILNQIDVQLGRESSENGLLDKVSPELSDELISFVSQGTILSEPPLKRRKLALNQAIGEAQQPDAESDAANYEPAIDCITVNQATWNIKYTGSKLSDIESPISRNVTDSLVCTGNRYGPQYIQLLASKRCIFHAELPSDKEISSDIYLALEVAIESKKWTQGHGRIWTESDIELSHQAGSDFLQIKFTIKWNITISPQPMIKYDRKSKTLTKVMNKYLPEPNVTKAQAWTPQDFYKSVHAPDKNYDVSSMEVKALETSLYPFQKRAVQWMLQKEGVEWSPTDSGIKKANFEHQGSLPISFIRSTDFYGRQCYVSHLLGLVTLDITPFAALERNLQGGILAEEMGLGKTVEIIALIALHKRSPENTPIVLDPWTAEYVRPTPATLIIAPPSILQQWISEINKHAPHLKVMQYKGIKLHHELQPADLLDRLACSDIVVSTYSTLAAEIHFTALYPEKKLRREAKYPRPKSPLMQLSWYRICIDEAQMIESGVSKAAIVARMIPRINAWCITGTPVRKDVNDLLGLLIFLRYEPYASSKHVWSSLISSHKHEFAKLFGNLALRHTKQLVRDELRLPAQRRYVITMPFSPIEEQHYQELFNKMCEESGVDLQGAPLIDNWNPENFSEVMRRWLVRLRQTALHPEVGERNRRALGHKDGPLRTVDQVLDAMMEQAEISIRTDQRAFLTTKMRRGQLFENSPRVRDALTIWTEAVEEATAIVTEARLQLSQESEKLKIDEKLSMSGNGSSSGTDVSSLDEEDEFDPSSRLGVFRNRLRGALEIEHVAKFFRANAYFQIKSNEDMTKPGTMEFESLEKLETAGYEESKNLRREILQEIFTKADRLMKRISKAASNQTFIEIPEFPTNTPEGGLESRRILEQLNTLATALDDQANLLDDWREQTIRFLLRPLVDEDEGVEVTGDEYEESTKTQDEVMVFVQALRAIIADRHDALTGQQNELVRHEMRGALRLAKDGEGAHPEKTLELLNARQSLKPAREMGSIRGIVGELRSLATSLRPDAENGNVRAQNELAIVDLQLKTTQKMLSEQLKATAGLEKEIDLFTSVMNTRLEYYRQLQQVSDMVAPYEGPIDERVSAKMLEEEDKLARKVATAKSKRRYLLHLREEADNPQEQRLCVICRENFEIGALTVCGHQYCKECIRLWWNAHRNCPICKRHLIQADLHEITYKPQELYIEAEEAHESTQTRNSPSPASCKSAIYSEVSKSKLAEIKSIELDGPSFTTKVDTLARHLIWLRESDPGAKSIIYSQFKDFLDVLARAFQRHRIGYSSIDRPNGIETFKQDPSAECFLLHSRAHSSGLNLVNASHVFLCEPLLNIALELQAIARVDRIGQQQETNVWLYLVDGTVEESIHQLSIRRRMEHIGRDLSNHKGKSRKLTAEELLDTKLEEANSLEMQQAVLKNLHAKGEKGGEMVGNEDLWDCLFGGAGQKIRESGSSGRALRIDNEIARGLRAAAVEERITEI